MIASGKAIDYLSKLDMDAVHEHEIKLNIITNKIKHLDAIEIIVLKMRVIEVEFVRF